MFNSLPQDSKLKSYLELNCSHLLSRPEGVTNIPISYVNPKVLSSLPDSVNLSNSLLKDYTRNLYKKAGIYAFYTDDEIVQVGSSISFSNRMRGHYINVLNLISLFILTLLSRTED